MHGYWGWGDGAAAWGNHYWGTGIMIVSGLIFVGLITWAVYWAARRGGKSLLGKDPEDALEILRARFARGEISTGEFRAMKEELADTSMTKQ